MHPWFAEFSKPGVPGECTDIGDFADSAAGDGFLDELNRGKVALAEARGEGAPGSPGSVQHTPAGAGVGRKGLFTQDMFACFKRRDRDPLVAVGRRRNDDGIDVFTPQEFFVVGTNRRLSGRGQGTSASSVGVADRDQFATRGTANRSFADPANLTGADKSEVHLRFRDEMRRLAAESHER